MSNHLAIATVTAAMRQMLFDAVNEDVTGTAVTIHPPDDTSLTNDHPRVNLFLYQVSPSPAWKNADLPARRQDGSLANRPQLGLDLHYLLTVYGKSTETDPEVHRVLGSAVRTLHERPVLTRDAIRAIVKQPSGSAAKNPLKDSDLADQVEMVKITPHALSIEELSKIWSVFFQTPYRPAVAYQASVVFIEGRSSPTPSLPVLQRAIHVAPLQQPVILSVEPQMVLPGAALTIKGRNLRADNSVVRFGDRDVAPDQPAREDRLTVTLPAGLRAGVNTVSVFHMQSMGSPPALRKLFESNVAAFMLRPFIVIPPALKAARKTVLTLKCEPAVERAQRVALLLDNRELAIPARPVAELETKQLAFPIPEGFPTGKFLARLRVDGAESSLEVDAGTGAYNGPLVEITA